VLKAFAIFFAFGATMSGLTIFLLLFPGTELDSLWRLNPDAHAAFTSVGGMSVLLMSIVGVSCGATAIGLWKGKRWAIRLALIVLSINIVGDLFNSVIRHDYRALIGLPVGGVMILYLLHREKRFKEFGV